MAGPERAPDPDTFSSRRSVVYAPNGVVATSQPLAAQAGVEMLQQGGNAFDAAVATAAALNVVEPTSTGLGGDAFMIYRDGDDNVGALQACGGAPSGATPEAIRDRASATEGMPSSGPLAVTVPGAARGWEETVQNHGRLTFATVLEPAIEYARDGYPATEVVVRQWDHAASELSSAGTSNPYLRGDYPPSVGQWVTLPELGTTLETVADEGADAVYEGAIAEQIVDSVTEAGGLLSLDDLRAFEPTYVEPVSTTYHGATVYELPPSNQGLAVLEALNIAEALDVDQYPPASVDRTHYLVEAMKRAMVDTQRYVTDPDYVEPPPLGARAHAENRAASIGPTASTPDIGGPATPDEDADTVVLSVADSDGNLVTFINSRYKWFGSGICPSGTGIALQNRGSAFTLDPEHPNVIAPGKRPFHTLIPGLVQLGEADWAAFGVMGGLMQPQGHLQLLSNIVDTGAPLQAALDRPRWRYRESGALAVEARMDDGLQTKLVRRGHSVEVLPPRRFGGAQIVRNNGGVLSGASDPRKDGQAVGY